jgi:hypothetical protein
MSIRAISPAVDRIDRLSADERWLADAREVADRPGGIVQRTVDMSAALACLDALTRAGARATISHLVLRAAALALARNQNLHRSVSGYLSSMPATVDIGLSAPDLGTAHPVLLRNVDDQPLPALVAATNGAACDARGVEARGATALQRYPWRAPFGPVRRLILRWLERRPWFRRRLAGTFQVVCAPNADVVVPLRFLTGSALGVGRVREEVVVVDGQFEVRSVMSLSLVVDHVAMDGVRAAALLNEITGILEGDELAGEIP